MRVRAAGHSEAALKGAERVSASERPLGEIQHARDIAAITAVRRCRNRDGADKSEVWPAHEFCRRHLAGARRRDGSAAPGCPSPGRHFFGATNRPRRRKALFVSFASSTSPRASTTKRMSWSPAGATGAGHNPMVISPPSETIMKKSGNEPVTKQ